VNPHSLFVKGNIPSHSKEKRNLRRENFSEGSDSQGAEERKKVKTTELHLEDVLSENMIETHLQKKARKT